MKSKLDNLIKFLNNIGHGDRANKIFKLSQRITNIDVSDYDALSIKGFADFGEKKNISYERAVHMPIEDKEGAISGNYYSEVLYTEEGQKLYLVPPPDLEKEVDSGMAIGFDLSDKPYAEMIAVKNLEDLKVGKDKPVILSENAKNETLEYEGYLVDSKRVELAKFSPKFDDWSPSFNSNSMKNKFDKIKVKRRSVDDIYEKINHRIYKSISIPVPRVIPGTLSAEKIPKERLASILEKSGLEYNLDDYPESINILNVRDQYRTGYQKTSDQIYYIIQKLYLSESSFENYKEDIKAPSTDESGMFTMEYHSDFSAVLQVVNLGCGWFAYGDRLSEDENAIVFYNKSFPKSGLFLFRQRGAVLIVGKNEVEGSKLRRAVSGIDGCSIKDLYAEQHLAPRKREGEMIEYIPNTETEDPEEDSSPMSFSEYKKLNPGSSEWNLEDPEYQEVNYEKPFSGEYMSEEDISKTPHAKKYIDSIGGVDKIKNVVSINGSEHYYIPSKAQVDRIIFWKNKI